MTLAEDDLERTKEPRRRAVYTVYMSKTVRLPEHIHEELKARKRSDETMAEVIARHLYRPHPAETRDILTGEESEAVEDAIDGLYGTDESDRLGRARRSQYRERV
jgi:predicted CopG family antitoxin